MWELDYKVWALKNWCFWTVVLEKTLESPLGCREIKPVHPKGTESWIFIERTVAGATILWPPDTKTCLIGIDPDGGKDWRWEEKGTTEDEMVAQHHRLSAHEFEQPGRWWRTGRPGVLRSMGLKELNTTQWLSNNLLNEWNDLYFLFQFLLFNAFKRIESSFLLLVNFFYYLQFFTHSFLLSETFFSVVISVFFIYICSSIADHFCHKSH